MKVKAVHGNSRAGIYYDQTRLCHTLEKGPLYDGTKQLNEPC